MTDESGYFRVYPCEIIRIVDGDTIEIRVDAGFRFHFTDKFRLKGINCPEMRTDEGKAARAWVLSYITACKMSGSKFFLKSHKHGKYRWLAEVIIQEPSGIYFNLNDEIVKAGHGEYYK